MKRTTWRLLLTLILATPLLANSQSTIQKIQVRTMSGAKWGFVDTRTNKRIIEAKYDEVQDFNKGIASVSVAGRAGLIDTLGNVLLPLEFAKVIMIGDRLVMVSKMGNKFALATANGQTLSQEIYDDMQGVSSGFIPAKKGDKWGYLDKQGKAICSFEFDQAEAFHEGHAKVGKKSNYQNNQFESILNAGVINSRGQLVAEPKYNYEKTMVTNDGTIILAQDLKNNSSMGYVTTGTIYSVLDKNEKTIISFDKGYQFDGIYDNFLFVSIYQNNSRKYGFLDWNGKEILPVNFHSIVFKENGTSWIAQVFFDPNNFFYLNDKFECFEYRGVKCPEK